VIVTDVPRHGIGALDVDDENARFEAADRLHLARPAGATGVPGTTVRALVEAQRRFGGMAPRAIVGGEFVVSTGTETLFEVVVGADYGALVAHGSLAGPSVASRIYPDWPYLPGLPSEYASSVLNGIASGPCAAGLPPGALRVDRAAFDEVESAGPVFAEAGAALCCILVAKLNGSDVEAALRAAIERW
jgi:hypothetical protein